MEKFFNMQTFDTHQSDLFRSTLNSLFGPLYFEIFCKSGLLIGRVVQAKYIFGRSKVSPKISP